VTGILNRITPEKFELLANKMIHIINEMVDSNDKFSLVLNAILEKASTEPSFAEQYADLCRYLSRQMKNFAWCVREAGGDSTNEKEIQKIFRNLMINTCDERYTEQYKIALQKAS